MNRYFSIMDTLGQDQGIDRRSSKINFHLQKMETIYRQVDGQTDVPHRHDYFTVLIIDQARGQHVIDYERFPFRSKEVHFVSPGQVHQVDLKAEPRGWVITFTRDFLVANNIPDQFISNINLFQSFGHTPPLKIDKRTFDRLANIIGEMDVCVKLQSNYKVRALGALLQLFLIYCSESTKFDANQLDEENAGICILRDFKQLIETHYSEWHKVKDYASQIHITPKHLSQTVKNITGKVAKDHIQDRLVLEAKRLLLHTDLSIKEIGYQIGFEEPLHFSAFFKKKASVSPSKFRDQH